MTLKHNDTKKLSNLLLRLTSKPYKLSKHPKYFDNNLQRELSYFSNLEIVDETAKFERYKLMLDSSKRNFSDFLEELHESTERAFVDQF